MATNCIIFGRVETRRVADIHDHVTLDCDRGDRITHADLPEDSENQSTARGGSNVSEGRGVLI